MMRPCVDSNYLCSFVSTLPAKPPNAWFPAKRVSRGLAHQLVRAGTAIAKVWRGTWRTPPLLALQVLMLGSPRASNLQKERR